MKAHTCSQEQFLKDVKDHKIDIIMDNGLYRHINFSKGSYCYSFNLVTWPGHLCIEGDIGTYVFTRIPDMFDFFRDGNSEELKINTRYWSEKCETKGNIKEFSVDSFRENVQEYIDEHWDLDEFIELEEDYIDESPDSVVYTYTWTEKQKDDDYSFRSIMGFDKPESLKHGPFGTKDEAIEDLKATLQEELEDVIASADDHPVLGYRAASEWKSEATGLELSDFWECSSEVYTYHFIWCLWAIAWGIRQYDEAKSASQEANQDGRG